MLTISHPRATRARASRPLPDFLTSSVAEATVVQQVSGKAGEAGEGTVHLLSQLLGDHRGTPGEKDQNETNKPDPLYGPFPPISITRNTPFEFYQFLNS